MCAGEDGSTAGRVGVLSGAGGKAEAAGDVIVIIECWGGGGSGGGGSYTAQSGGLAAAVVVCTGNNGWWYTMVKAAARNKSEIRNNIPYIHDSHGIPYTTRRSAAVDRNCVKKLKSKFFKVFEI